MENMINKNRNLIKKIKTNWRHPLNRKYSCYFDHKMKRLSEPVINKNCVKNLNFDEIKILLQRHNNNYEKRYKYFGIECEWKLKLIDTIKCFTSKNMYGNRLLLGPIRKIERLGFSHV